MISPRCQSVRDTLAQYVDGVLPEAEGNAIREHLELCPRCTEAERLARAIPVLLANPIDPPPPPTLLPRIMSGLHRITQGERHATAIVAASFLLAAAAALAGTAPLTEQAGVGARLLQLAHLKTAISEPQLTGPARVPGREPLATPADSQLPRAPVIATQPTPAPPATAVPIQPAAPTATAPAPAAVDTQPQPPEPPPQQSPPPPAPVAGPPISAPLLTAPPLTTSPAVCPAPLSPVDATAIGGSSTLPDAQPVASSGQSVTQLPAPGCPSETATVPGVSIQPAPTLAPIAGVPPNS